VIPFALVVIAAAIVPADVVPVSLRDFFSLFLAW
jgi:hypothetical protein